jgi:predicted nucleic acid-binding protein
MNGEHLLIDTNIALYLLSGDSLVAEILNGFEVYVSCITELELLGYQGISAEEQDKVVAFLNDCIIIDITDSIKKATIKLKQSKKIKLPDAIIAATAIYLNIPLISADSGFENIDEIQFIRYDIQGS